MPPEAAERRERAVETAFLPLVQRRRRRWSLPGEAPALRAFPSNRGLLLCLPDSHSIGDRRVAFGQRFRQVIDESGENQAMDGRTRDSSLPGRRSLAVNVNVPTG